MTKMEVIASFGKPYKESSSTNDRQVVIEDLYYKEQLYVGRWYEVNTILHFENAVFKFRELGKEKLVYEDHQVIVK